MKRQLTTTLVFVLVVGYTALFSTSPCKKVAAHQPPTGDYVIAFDFSIPANQYATGHVLYDETGNELGWTVRIWDANNDQLLHTIQVPDLRGSSIPQFSISRVVFSPSGDRLAISLWGDIPHSLIMIVDTSTGETLLEISDMPSIDTIDWSPDGKYLVLCQEDSFG